VSAESGRRYEQRDVDFAMELARRAAVAIDNAMLHEQTVAALRSADEANRAKAQFLAVMSHELRAPLNAIAGYAELLRTGVRGPISPEQAQDLDRIVHSERTLLSLINNILNFARIEAGRVEVSFERVIVSDLLESARTMIAPQLAAKQQLLTLSSLDRALAICTDLEKTRQILLNLLSNAVKFTAPHSRIAVSVHEVGAQVDIVVEDDGPGIPETKLATIFEPFVQLERGYTSEQQGAGLGLSISRDLARAMKGNLTVESTVGKGSRFTLSLPRDCSSSWTSDAARPGI
jgi:signal transduction histidine kinase